MNFSSTLNYAPMSMQAISILFAMAAVFGLTILVRRPGNKKAPRMLSLLHGVLAATGFALLIYYAMQNPGNYPKAGLVFFIAAALGGFYVLYRDLKKGLHPVALAMVHALIAAGGVASLIVFALS